MKCQEKTDEWMKSQCQEKTDEWRKSQSQDLFWWLGMSHTGLCSWAQLWVGKTQPWKGSGGKAQAGVGVETMCLRGNWYLMTKQETR